ncbi:MAG: hypothetical protein RIS84_260 [Pseudomonadota bacterium]|jgi:hypothetical protein
MLFRMLMAFLSGCGLFFYIPAVSNYKLFWETSRQAGVFELLVSI